MFSGHNVFGYVIINAVSNSKNNCTVYLRRRKNLPLKLYYIVALSLLRSYKIVACPALISNETTVELQTCVHNGIIWGVCNVYSPLVLPFCVYTAVYVIFSFLAFFWIFPYSFYVGQDGMSRKEERNKRREIEPKKRELHELPYTETI